jgi:protease-4
MRTYFQQMVNDIYGDFVGIVAKGRKMDTGRVNEIAQGHVYTGLRAKELGLTDKWGGLQRALQSAAWKAGIKEYSTVYYPVLKSPLEMLFGSAASEELGKELIKSQTGELYPTMMEAKRALQSTGMQMRMPWDVTVR